MKANENILRGFATSKKCFMCKYQYDQPLILPHNKPVKKLSPNFNGKALFHLFQSHGIPPEYVMDWVVQSVYGMKMTLDGGKPIFEEIT